MKTFILAVLLLSISAGARAQLLTPLQFNDQLTGITDSLATFGQRWGTQFNEAVKSKNFASLKPYRQKMSHYANARMKQVEGMKDVSSSHMLRAAMVTFLRYELSMIEQAFQPLETLAPDVKTEELKRRYDFIKTFTASEKQSLKSLLLRRRLMQRPMALPSKRWSRLKHASNGWQRLIKFAAQLPILHTQRPCVYVPLISKALNPLPIRPR